MIDGLAEARFLQELLLEMTQQHSSTRLLDLAVQRLASREHAEHQDHNVLLDVGVSYPVLSDPEPPLGRLDVLQSLDVALVTLSELV